MIRFLDLEHPKQPEVSPDRLYEFHAYGLMANVQSISFGGVPLVNTKGYWLLQTPFVVGNAFIEYVTVDEEPKRQRIRLLPDPSKVESREQWRTMMKEILRWWQSLLGSSHIRFGGVKFGGPFHTVMFEALLESLLDWTMMVEDFAVPWVQATQRQLTPKSLSALTPSDWQNLQGSPVLQRQLVGDEQTVQMVTWAYPTNLQHPASSVLARLIDELLDCVERLSVWMSTESTRHWMVSRVEMLSESEERLQALSRCFERIDPRNDFSPSSWMDDVPHVLIDLIHEGKQLLTAGLHFDNAEALVMQPYSYQIYELWCYQTIVNQLAKDLSCEPEFSLQETKLHWGVSARFDTLGGPIEVLYNPRFSAVWEHSGEGMVSLIGEQRPDIVIRSAQAWCVLDAKYRSGLNNVLDAFDSAFSYLESLRDTDRGGMPTHSILLLPQSEAQTEVWFSDTFIQTNRFGCVRLNPEAAKTYIATIVTWVAPWLQPKVGEQ